MNGEVVKASFTFSDGAIEYYRGEAMCAAKYWIINVFGERCEDFSEACPCCQKWKAFDELFGSKP